MPKLPHEQRDATVTCSEGLDWRDEIFQRGNLWRIRNGVDGDVNLAFGSKPEAEAWIAQHATERHQIERWARVIDEDLWSRFDKDGRAREAFLSDNIFTSLSNAKRIREGLQSLGTDVAALAVNLTLSEGAVLRAARAIWQTWQAHHKSDASWEDAQAAYKEPHQFPKLYEAYALAVDEARAALMAGLSTPVQNVVPTELCQLTFAVQHNPNCPSPWLVRLPGKGPIDMKPYGDALRLVRHETGDILGFGKTLDDAARAALSSSRAGTLTADDPDRTECDQPSGGGITQ